MNADQVPDYMPGWKILTDALVALADHHGFKVVQVKEKFGGLRFYADTPQKAGTTNKDHEHYRSRFHAACESAENLSFYICMQCGAPARAAGIGWINVLCETHRKEYETKVGK